MGGLVARRMPLTNVNSKVPAASMQSSCNTPCASFNQRLNLLTNGHLTSRCQKNVQGSLSIFRISRLVLHSVTWGDIAYSKSIALKPAGRTASQQIARSALGKGNRRPSDNHSTNLGPEKAPVAQNPPQQTANINPPTQFNDTPVPSDIVSENEFWRQQLESTLGDLSGRKGPDAQEGPAQDAPWLAVPSFFGDPQRPPQENPSQSYSSPPPPVDQWGQPIPQQESPSDPQPSGEASGAHHEERAVEASLETDSKVGQQNEKPTSKPRKGSNRTPGGGARRPSGAPPGRPTPALTEQQAQNSPTGPGTSRRKPAEAGSRPASAPVLPQESTVGAQSRNTGRVDRSELTKLRQSLNKKLSEANMYNRHLQREVSERDKAVIDSTVFLGSLQAELKSLLEVAKEIAAGGTKPVTRKINGRYIQSHLASRLEELYSQLNGQLENVDDVRLREVPITWAGVAEDVKIMGSFDGWTRGQHLSPETTGSYTMFSAILQLRPGRYEVKFVVDGNWQLAPSWPVVGDGLSANNLLVVD